ncbi:MAG: MerR family transcriptional regulator [Bacteroidia bacterium]|nr:MAG: MerR family transcriptional regulator [Bacteroidia bacterium]
MIKLFVDKREFKRLSSLSTYSIKDLEKLSGIKAHTLRIWEQRYGVLKPQRTESNIRYYSNEDLKKILNINILNNHGIKISKIVKLSDKEISQKVIELSQVNTAIDTQIDALMLAMIELDELRFEQVVTSSIVQNGFENTISKIIFPFLKKIGVMWQTGAVNPAQEHFISNLIRQKVIVGIDRLPYPTSKTAPRYMFFLPEGELHELSLLLYCYMAKARGAHTIYLGQSVPLDDIQKVFNVRKPQFIVSVFTFSFQIETEEYIKQLSKVLSESTILLSGFQLMEYKKKLPSNIKIFKEPEDFAKLVEDHIKATIA